MTSLNSIRRATILVVPLLTIVFSLAHGLDWLVMHGMHEDYDAFLEYIVEIRGRWLAVHVAGLMLFPMLGVVVWWMLPAGGVAGSISRAALAAYVVLYPAFDAVAGIGSAVVAEYREGLPEAQRPAIDGVIWSLLGEADPAFYLGEVASWAWVVGTLAAATALWREHGWRVAVPLALAGAAMGYSHFPPFGAMAGAFLAVAAWQFLARTGRSMMVSPPAETASH